MDYKRLDRIFKAKNITLKHFLTKNVGLTVNGFRLAQKKETLKVIDLEKISKALNIPMSYWWEDEAEGMVMMDGQVEYGLTNNERRIYLSTIDTQNKVIADYQERLAVMEDKKREQSSG